MKTLAKLKLQAISDKRMASAARLFSYIFMCWTIFLLIIADVQKL